MNRIRYLRELNGELQSDLAKILNITPVAIGNYENEKRDIPTESLKILSEHFDVSIDYLLGKSDIKSSSSNASSINDSDLHFTLSKEDKGYISEELKNNIRNYINFIIEEEKKKVIK